MATAIRHSNFGLSPPAASVSAASAVCGQFGFTSRRRDGRRRLTELPLVPDSLRYLVSLLRTTGWAWTGGGVGAWWPGIGAGAFLEPQIDIGHAKTQPVAEPDTGRQGTAGRMAVVYGLQGKPGEFSQFGWGQQLLHVRFLGNRHMPALGIAMPMQEVKAGLSWPGGWITGSPHGSLAG